MARCNCGLEKTTPTTNPATMSLYWAEVIPTPPFYFYFWRRWGPGKRKTILNPPAHFGVSFVRDTTFFDSDFKNTDFCKILMTCNKTKKGVRKMLVFLCLEANCFRWNPALSSTLSDRRSMQRFLTDAIYCESARLSNVYQPALDVFLPA